MCVCRERCCELQGRKEQEMKGYTQIEGQSMQGSDK